MRFLLLPLVLLAAPAGDSLELGHEAGRTVSRSFSVTTSTELESMESNGEDRSGTYSVTTEREFALAVTDAIEAVDEGAATKLARTYDELSITSVSALEIGGPPS